MFGGRLLVLLDEDGEFIERPRREFRDRLDPLHESDQFLLRYYRFPRHAILEMCEQLAPALGRRTARGHALPVHTQVMVSLRFMASGTFQNVLGTTAGISQSSCSRVFRPFCSALVAMARETITFPLGDAAFIARIKQEFFAIRGFPGVIGSLDGSHVCIKAPIQDEPNYVNRHGTHSINVQAICDARLRIMHVLVQWPGSTHDSFIWRQSRLKEHLDAGVVPNGWLLGDSGYPLEQHLLTPIRDPQPGPEQRYNTSQLSTRCTIERCFGVLKSRFRCLDSSGGVLLYTPQRARNIIVAGCVLHNWCIDRNIPLLEPLVIGPVADDQHHLPDLGHDRAGIEVRQRLLETRFANP